MMFSKNKHLRGKLVNLEQEPLDILQQISESAGFLRLNLDMHLVMQDEVDACSF